MVVRVGINGFGRMGRLAARAALEGCSQNLTTDFDTREIFDIVHINEAKGTAETGAHLLQFDSVHGRWGTDISHGDDSMSVDGKTIRYTTHDTIDAVPWEDSGVDLVLDCTGTFKTSEALAPYFKKGVKKVVVSAPVKDGPLNIVMGVNDYLYNPKTDHIVTAASCTTNCLAPVVKVIQEGLGIDHGVITTVHDVTNTQTVIDAPLKDLRRSRSSLMSLIPTTTGSATAITLIYPELKGKLNGVAVRVPLLNASLTDCVFEVKRNTTVEEVNSLLEDASKTSLYGILGYETRPLVSVDYVNDVRSSIVDAPSTMVVDGTQVKILAWYDNEYAYAYRLVELGVKVAQSL